MTSTEYPQDAACEKCGMGVHLNHEGKTACNGCGFPTDRCNCEGAP